LLDLLFNPEDGSSTFLRKTELFIDISLALSLTLKMEAVSSSEMLVSSYQLRSVALQNLMI
jgi:hypothetical protein